MAKRNTSKPVLLDSVHFKWRIYRRSNGVWYADGRTGNGPSLGQHSLQYSDEGQALKMLRNLDRLMAVKRGLVADTALHDVSGSAGTVSLADGVENYLEYTGRSEIAGGARDTTVARYRAVLQKFVPFAQRQGVRTWSQVTKRVLLSYVESLEKADYKYATTYFEAMVVKQVVSFLVKEELLPATNLIQHRFRPPSSETTTYCFQPAEVEAMLQYCGGDSKLRWIYGIILTLSRTGLRIGELASLRWADLSPDLATLTIRDASRRGTSADRATASRTKGGRSRSLPVTSELQDFFRALEKKPDGLFFRGSHGGRLKPDNVRIALRRDVLEPLASRFPKPAGSTERGFLDGRLHSFRHCFCSVVASHGHISEHVLMSWLGHRDSDMVRRYFHLFRDGAAAMIKTVDFTGATRPAAFAEQRPD